MMEETLQICERAERSTQDASHRKTFHSVCSLPATCTLDRRRSRSRSNMGDRNHPVTSKSKLVPVTIR
jgi:hypothetical protein